MRSRKRWTEDELLQLEQLIGRGLSDEAIGKRLGATAVAVNIARKRHGIAPRGRVLLTARTVAARLGVGCSKTIAWWIKQGWLQGRKGQRCGKNRMWYVSEDALQEFLEDERYWHLWDPARITDSDWRTWAYHQRTVRFLTTREVGDRFAVCHSTVHDWIQRGLLPAVRHGNWLIREIDLAGFVPPCERPKTGLRLKRYSANEDRWLRYLLRQGSTVEEIAGTLERNSGSIYGRLARLGLKAAAAA